MNTNEKQLLLQDLCARLPYGVIVRGVFLNYNKTKDKILYEECDNILTHQMLTRYESLKPYLRPMSSMTEEEMGNLEKCLGKKYDFRFTETESFIYIDWLNAHHFDYRGLIEMGLALEAHDGMYKTN